MNRRTLIADLLVLLGCISMCGVAKGQFISADTYTRYDLLPPDTHQFKIYYTEGEQIVFKRPLGIPRDSIVLPAGYEIVSCSVAAQVLMEKDGRVKLAFVNPGSGGQLEVTIKARKLNRRSEYRLQSGF